MSAAAPQKAVQFGERLRREREMRGIKLDEIAESTKISKRNLQALEDERFDLLPGGIFNKGFVRAYAKYLGIDEEQAVNDFLTASANYDLPATLQPPPTSVVKPPVIPSDETLRRKQRLWALLALLVLVFGLAAWYKYTHRSATSAPAPTNAAPQAPAKQSDAGTGSAANTTDQAASTTNQNTSSSSTNAAAAETPAAGSAPNASAPANTPAENAPQNANPASGADAGAANSNGNDAASAAPSEASYTAAAGEWISLDVKASEATWISANADGKPLLNVVLQPGESRRLRAEKHLVLKTGNAAGISVNFNGKELPPLGAEKQVKTLAFSVGQP